MKITFEDWKSGKFTIEGTYFTSPNELPEPIIVGWQGIELEEQKKIRSTQFEIFSKLCQDELDFILLDFNLRYENSQFKKLLIERELDKLNELLFSNSNANPTNSNYKWGNINPFNYGEDFFLKAIRSYFIKCYIDGYSVNFDFVNSPDSPYCLPLDGYDQMPEVQGEVLYSYYNHLNQTFVEKPINFDNRYWNLKTFELFKYLSTEFVHSNPISKFNQIFHFLKEINSKEPNNYSFSMKKEFYYEFILKNICADFVSNKGGIPTMNPPETNEKETAFNKLYHHKLTFESMQ